MKSNLRLWVSVFIFCFCLNIVRSTAQEQLLFPDPEATISMDFQDARLKDILKVFSIQSGLNFIASQALEDRTVTLYLDGVSIKEAMDKLFKANNLSYELDRGSNIIIVKEWGKAQVETVTEVFYLQYATVSTSSLKEEMAQQMTSGEGGGESAGTSTSGGTSEGGKWGKEEEAGITKIVAKLLSEYGSVIEDFRTNSLIVTDIPSRISIIAQTIAALDIPIPQVMLEVEMLDVSKNVLERIGIKFGDISLYPSIVSATLTGATRYTGFPFSAWTGGDFDRGARTGSNIAGNLSSGSLAMGNYQMLLDFIKSQTDTRYLARPRLLTLNNETAEIKITTDEMIGLTQTISGGGTEGLTSSTTEAERAETGVSLRVTPQINRDTKEITMFIVPKVKDAQTSGLNSSYKDPEERSTKTMVRVRDGETVIIGGLIRNQSNDTITKLPILGDLPFIGRLFSHRNRTKGIERELLVFITPHILDDASIELANAKKTIPLSPVAEHRVYKDMMRNLPEREQSVELGIDRQAIISSSLNGFDRKKK